uniref:Uncharacterized protein n=1 Tax=Chromera velia CCMP2878 TaxID=1169474 RepID=A0A0G4FVV4_9ALVE|eukprot:Cvel_3812.t1-p1 / transcript=Cvel_3812.t1 / gene=Cvel_3812 / organism=Chromera_velia_CCMP2878 / gene_product=hypothetical protein / transcript_product=hypothetical protein / location=Cvel_scaffold160:106517-106762(+) / protein_length=82 / sequence_SO=supercontig / SO=protein_coding / is_pseudo=false
MGTSHVTARGSAEASPLSLLDTVASPTGASSSSSREEGAPPLLLTNRGREHPRSRGSVAAPPPGDDYTRVRDARGSTARLSL